MGKYDKDRHQKQMAIRYCLAQGMTPCLEVVVDSASDLSDSPEVLTDLDVVGLGHVSEGPLRRILFDCKTGSKLSAINRAFWGAGVLAYTGCDAAFVVLKNRAVYNHRLSALKLNVDLHDEKSFQEIGNAIDVGFDQDSYYQSTIDRWNAIYDVYSKNAWAGSIFQLGRNVAPLTTEPWRVFRKLVAELRAVRGQIDPAKPAHIAMYFDTLAAVFILWSTMGRDVRRFYEPQMAKADFERALRYYIWGGKESYQVRQELRQKADPAGQPQDFPSWPRLVSFAGLVIAAPQSLFGCISICRDLSIRAECGKAAEPEKRLAGMFRENRHARQFVFGASDYLIDACNLPKDLAKAVDEQLNGL